MAGTFRVHPSPTKNENDTREVAGTPAGVVVKTSRNTGVRLPDETDGSKDHPPEIPWPQPALGVDHMPMRNMK